MPIVVKIPEKVKAGGAKGHCYKRSFKEGRTEVLDADLSKYFDIIPHDKLQIALKERISDPRMLKLINKWLKVPVKEKLAQLF